MNWDVGAKMSNSNDDNYTVDCADESFRMTLLCGVIKMQKYPAISLLVIAWHDHVEVSHRLAVGGIHQYIIVIRGSNHNIGELR